MPDTALVAVLGTLSVRPELWIVVGGSLVLLLFILLPRAGPKGDDARWATALDIGRCGGFAAQGVVIGRWGWRRRKLRADPDGHVLLAAPTRSGKGVGFVIPNLLDWPGSVVVLDLKGENYARTAGYRIARGHAVYRFAPEARQTDRWNALSYVTGARDARVRDLQQLAAMLYPVAHRTDNFWVNQARELFAGAVLLNLETKPVPPTLGDVYRLLALPELDNFILDELGGRAFAFSEDCARRLLGWASIDAAATRAGILASALERLQPWSEPRLDAATAQSDFDFRLLRQQAMAIYVDVAPRGLIRLHSVLRVFFEQLIQANAEGAFGRGQANRFPVLVMLDEFPAFGRLDSLVRGIAFMASYGMRFGIVAQSEAQLQAIYGSADTQVLIDNCATRIYFAPNSAAEAERISRSLGTRRVVRRTRSHTSGLLGRRTDAKSEMEQPLLRPQQLRGLRDDCAVILRSNCPPILARKIRWFADPEYRQRPGPDPAASPAGCSSPGDRARPVPSGH